MFAHRRAAARRLRLARRRGSPSSPRPSSTRVSCGAARAMRGRRSNVDAMVRDLSEVRIGDPVVHEQHGIGRYLGLVTLDVGDGATEFLQLDLRQRRQAVRAGLEPASHRPLQRRVARGRTAARARQRTVGEGQAQGGAAGARHGGGAPQPLCAARGAQRPRVRVQGARLRGIRRGLRIRGDAGPAGGDRGGDRRPDGRPADGPARLRRRRLRQDRSRAARRVHRARRRQAGRAAGADDAARRAALPGVLRSLRGLAR